MKDRPEQAARIPCLDGLRAFAIALVLFGHSLSLQDDFAWKWLGSYSEFGVRVFFVLSGFLITTLLLKELEVTQRISLKNFYLRRVFRIFPASYTYILTISILGAFGVIALHPHDLLHAVTYTANYDAGRSWYIAHLWSLSVEEQFYILWPVTLVLAGRRRGMVIALVVCFLVPVIRSGEFVLFPAARFDIGARFETAADSLAIGCLLAGMRGWLSGRPWYNRLLSSRLFVLVPVLTLLMVLPHGLHTVRYRLTVGESLMNLGIALCMDWCMRFSSHPIGKVLNWRPVVFIGVLSYSLYIWQQPFLDRYVASLVTTLPLSLILVFAAALASHYVIEQPFLRLKKRFEPRHVKIATAAVANPL